MQYLKQSTAITLKIGPFLDDSDGKTAETGLTIAQADIRLSKNGSDIAQKTEATSCTHDELGIYGCPIDDTDTGTLGRLQLWVHESGALPVWHEYMVVPANVYDSLFSTDKLEVDINQIGGAAQSATDLKDFADTGYDPSAHRTQAQIKAMDSGVLTATAIAADAIGSSEFAQAAADKVWATAIRALSAPADYKADVSALALEATLSDIKGTGFVKDTHSLPQCLTATGFSTHNAAAIWSAASRELSTPANYKADVSLIALEATLTAMKQTTAGSFDRDTDSLEAIRNRGDIAWITGGGGGGGDATAANQTTIIDHLTDVKGTGFVKDTHSLKQILDFIQRTLGLTQENHYIDNTIFETGKLKSARIRISF
jgi:hypothetical protein